jgi:hypothetical protein
MLRELRHPASHRLPHPGLEDTGAGSLHTRHRR